MAGTKIEISGPKSLLSNEFLCNSTSLLNSRKRRTVEVRKPVAATAAFTLVQMVAKLIELDSIKVISENPVQFTISGQVTVEYDAMEQMKELMFNWWDSSKTTIDAQRGVFLQLVSSDIDPNPKSESPVNETTPMYVPRDEAFRGEKKQSVDAGSWKGMMNNLFPFFKYSSESNSVNSFADINNLYKESRNHSNFPVESAADTFKFDPPNIVSRDASCCLQDDEFGRFKLAGMNPISIERLKVFPPVSKLDPSIYGPTQSALREEHLISHLDGMSVQKELSFFLKN
ncbi:hypothetical protein J1N35_033022 [Gossypium stocksii]|uniref:Lipoxygenase domain-containing protein n=1 Tax=Gossypium stocksii TaxID=47602 RepID=A0A9D3UPD1_9ROSI|nr:hypothetical protein J1N35_033022 [Gossypium stocksii]